MMPQYQISKSKDRFVHHKEFPKLAIETFMVLNGSWPEIMKKFINNKTHAPTTLNNNNKKERLNLYLRTQSTWVENAFMSLYYKSGNQFLTKWNLWLL